MVQLDKKVCPSTDWRHSFFPMNVCNVTKHCQNVDWPRAYFLVSCRVSTLLFLVHPLSVIYHQFQMIWLPFFLFYLCSVWVDQAQMYIMTIQRNIYVEARSENGHHIGHNLLSFFSWREPIGRRANLSQWVCGIFSFFLYVFRLEWNERSQWNRG